MPKGSPIYYPDVQSDIDMKGMYKFLNLPSSGSSLPINASIYVDPVNGSSAGVRGQSSPFQTLAQAVAVVQSGDYIIMRPGTYTMSAPVVINVSNVTVTGYGAKIVAAAETTGNLIQLSADNITLEGLDISGARPSNSVAAIQNWGTVYTTTTNARIRFCRIHDTIGRCIYSSGVVDGLDISDCEFFKFYQGVACDSISGTGTYRVSIARNKIHDVWATTGYPGAIKLHNTSAAIITGSASNNKLWNGQNTGNEVGIEVQGSFTRFSYVGNTISQYTFGTSFDSVTEGLVDSNTINGCSYCGIEFVQMIGGSATGNVINGLKDDGTSGGGVGYSLSTNGGDVSANVEITGGSVTNCVNAVHSDRTSGIFIHGLYTYQSATGGTPYNLQRGQNFTVENTWNDMQVEASYGIFTEIDAGNLTKSKFYYRFNTFNISNGGTQYSTFRFYSSDNTGTFNDVLIEGTRTPSVFWGDGAVSTSGPTVNSTTRNNYPSVISSNQQFGFYNNVILGVDGGTGIANSGKTITLGGNLVTSGDNNVTLTTTGATNVTLPTSGTVESQSNKGQVSGYASLDGSGKVPAAQLPTLSAGTIASTTAVLKGDGSGNAVASTPTGTGDNVLANTPTLITPVLGVATATSINGLTVTASTGTLTVPNGVTATAPEITTLLGFRHIPQNSKSANYTVVLADSGKEIYHPVGDNNARTFTIDSNANVAYPIGTVILFTNMAVANLSVAITTDTMTLLGSGLTGTRTIAQYGSMAAKKDTSTSWNVTPIANVT